MRTIKPATGNIHGTETMRLVNLETELMNIHYLLALPETTDTQRERLRSLLVRVEAELRESPAKLRGAACLNSPAT
jgi:hypothetical protein